MFKGVPLDDTLFDTKAFTTIWTTFWGKAAPECFVEHAVKIPNIRTWVPEDETTFMYLRLPDDTYFPCGVKRILITETYTSFYTELCEEELRWARDRQSLLSRSHSTVMTGQPGIGMSAATLTSLVLNMLKGRPPVSPTSWCGDFRRRNQPFTAIQGRLVTYLPIPVSKRCPV